ncbi:hypothetical protein Efla_004113 [Eimeria flavescens]
MASPALCFVNEVESDCLSLSFFFAFDFLSETRQSLSAFEDLLRHIHCSTQQAGEEQLCWGPPCEAGEKRPLCRSLKGLLVGGPSKLDHQLPLSGGPSLLPVGQARPTHTIHRTPQGAPRGPSW